MDSYRKNLIKRYKQVIAVDSIRLLKILEMVQESIILVILSIIVAFTWNRIVHFFKLNIHANDNNMNNATFLKDCLKLILHTFIIIIVTFYIRKIGLVIPSISSLINPKFRSNTTIHYAIPIAIVAIFIGLVPSYSELLARINKYQQL